MLIFLQLYAAHLIADFILQPKWIVLHKQKAGPLFAHAGIHVACGIALVNVGLDRNVLLAILGLALAHILIDYIKALLTKDGWVVFFIDQILHLGTIVGAAIWLNWASWLFVEETVVATLTSAPFYLLLAAYVGVIFGGSIVVQKVTRPAGSQARASQSREVHRQHGALSRPHLRDHRLQRGDRVPPGRQGARALSRDQGGSKGDVRGVLPGGDHDERRSRPCGRAHRQGPIRSALTSTSGATRRTGLTSWV